MHCFFSFYPASFLSVHIFIWKEMLSKHEPGKEGISLELVILRLLFVFGVIREIVSFFLLFLNSSSWVDLAYQRNQRLQGNCSASCNNTIISPMYDKAVCQQVHGTWTRRRDALPSRDREVAGSKPESSRPEYQHCPTLPTTATSHTVKQ